VVKKTNKYFVITGEGMRMCIELFSFDLWNSVEFKNYIKGVIKKGINPVLN